jgi:WD40 repeat protein
MDCERFVLRFFDVIEASAPHIYHSAFLWAPESSLIRKMYRDKAQLTNNVKVLNSIDTSWDGCIRTIQTINRVCVVEFSYRGDLVAVGGKEGCVQVFEASTGICLSTLMGHKYPVKTVAFAPDDASLASGSWDFDIRLWDLQTGGLIRILEGHTSAVWSVAFSPCGTKIASCAEDGTIRVWDSDAASEYGECILDDSGWPLAVCWSAIGTEIISGSDDGTVKVWDISAQSCSRTLNGHTDSVLSVRSSQNSSFIASGSRDGTVNLYDPYTGDVIRTITTIGHVHSIRFVPDGKHLVYATLHLACVFDLSKGLDVSVYNCDGKQVAFSPDGNSMVSGADADAFVTVLQTKGRYQGRGKTDYHSGSVVSVRFALDGRLLASLGPSELKLWDIAKGSCISTFSHHIHLGSVAFSPDSLLVASTNKDATLIRNVQSSRLIWTLRSDAGPIVGLAFSPDSSQLVAVSHLGGIQLWDVVTGQLLARRGDSSQQSQVRPRISFTADGTSVVVDNTTWRISPVSVFAAGTSSNRLSLAFVRGSETKSVPGIIPPQYYLAHDEGWVLNQQGKRICWVPPDRRSTVSNRQRDAHGNMLALGSKSGKVTILDFSDVPS